MIAFLLGLLKGIGIVLLTLLILFVVILGIVLFVPLRYSGTGQITKEKKEASAQVTWLLRAVKVRLDYAYPQKPELGIRIFGIDVLKLLEKRKKQEPKKSSKSKKHKNKQRKTQNAENTENAQNAENTQNTASENTPGVEEAQQVTQDRTENTDQEAKKPTVSEEKTEDNAPGESTEAKKTFSEKIALLRGKIEAIIDKIKDIIYNIKYYYEVLQEEDTKQLLADAWEAILKILKSIRPRVFCLDGEIGFATPDTTGKLYGVYAMFLPTIGEYIRIEPNFEEQVLLGRVNFKGQITIFVIVVNVLRVLFDKRLRPLINKLKNGGNRNGRE